MTFSVSGNNNGLVVGKDAYYNTEANKNDVTNSILKSQGGGADYGFESGLMVEMSVQQKMGGTIPELKQDITNANVRMGALSNLTTSMNTFMFKTIDLLSDPKYLSGFDVTVAEPSAAKVTVAAGSENARASQYTLDVMQIAKAHTISTEPMVRTDPIGSGTLEISTGSYSAPGDFTDNRSGKGGVVDIEVGDTIDDVARKINDGNMGVTAMVVDSANGAQLAIYSDETGASNALNIKVTPDGAPGSAALNALVYDGADTATFKERVAAHDAEFNLNGIRHESSTNTIKDLMGLDMVLTGETTVPTTVTVEQDAKVLVDNIQFFVDNFNAVMDVADFLNKPTLGENFQGSLHDTEPMKEFTSQLGEVEQQLKKAGASLMDIGIDTDPKGFLVFSRSTLEENLAKNPSIINDIFISKNTATNHQVSVKEIGNSEKGGYYTQNGTYDIEIISKAEKATLSGQALGDPVTIAAGDDILSLKVNGTDIDIQLEAGKTYTKDELTLEISNQINRNSEIKEAGTQVEVSVGATGEIQLTSSDFGSKFSFEVMADNLSLGFTLGDTAEGKDVMGKINGVTAMGDGNDLYSMIDPETKGLVLEIDPNAPVGNLGTATVQRGYLSSLRNTMNSMINGETGAIKSAMDEYEKSLDEENPDSLVNKLTEAEEQSEKLYKQYWGRYSSVESMLSYSASIENMLEVMYFKEQK